jgi:hypothetical protein
MERFKNKVNLTINLNLLKVNNFKELTSKIDTIDKKY